MDGIPISEEKLNRFRQQTYEDHSANGGEDDKIFTWVKGIIERCVDLGDNLLIQKHERLGTDEKTKMIYSELAAIVACDEFSIEQLKESPKFFLGAITVGLAAEKILVLQTLKKEARVRPASRQFEPETSQDHE